MLYSSETHYHIAWSVEGLCYLESIHHSLKFVPGLIQSLNIQLLGMFMDEDE